MNELTQIRVGNVDYNIADATAREASLEVVNVSGTQPTINGVANTMYICGEVLSLTINPPSNGMIDVRFRSGSQATVLRVPQNTKWHSSFDPTTLNTNTTYELNISDGIYGAVMSWGS